MMEPKQLSREVVAEVLDDLKALANDPTYLGEVIAEMERSIEEMADTMLKKGEDYSGSGHQFTNFELNAATSGLSTDQVFLALIGVKYSRLANLLKPRPYVDETLAADQITIKFARPNFESVEDSWLDMANYLVLLIGYKRFKRRFGPHAAGLDSTYPDATPIQTGEIPSDPQPSDPSLGLFKPLYPSSG